MSAIKLTRGKLFHQETSKASSSFLKPTRLLFLLLKTNGHQSTGDEQGDERRKHAFISGTESAVTLAAKPFNFL